MEKKIKMVTVSGKWYVVDGDRVVEFEKSYDAWCFVLLLKSIRPRVPYIRSLYPVKSLDPRPSRVRKSVEFN